MCASYVFFFRADSRRAIGPTTGLCNLAILIILQLDRLAGRFSLWWFDSLPTGSKNGPFVDGKHDYCV